MYLASVIIYVVDAVDVDVVVDVDAAAAAVAAAVVAYVCTKIDSLFEIVPWIKKRIQKSCNR